MLDACFVKYVGNCSGKNFEVSGILRLPAVYSRYKFFIFERMQVFKSKIFELELYVEYTQSSGQRSVYLKCLHGLRNAFLRRHILEGAHVVKSVCQLDDKNSYVF